MLRLFTLLCLLVALGMPATADAFVTKKKYAEYLSSLPPEGDQPTQEYVQRAVEGYFKLRLKDAESARYEWGTIELGTWKGFAERFGTPGWIATVHVNSKNSYGAYPGFSPFKFIFRSGSIIEVYEFRERENAWVALIGSDGAPIPPLPVP